MRWVWLVLFAGLACPVWAQDTGWLSPSQDYGDFVQPQYAYQDDNLYARGYPEHAHIYYGFPFSIPATAEITGIEVRLDAWRWPSGVPFFAYIEVRLSGDGGRSVTTSYTAGPLAGYEQTYILGGPTDTWGRSWRPEEFQPTTFMVFLYVDSPRGREIRLDWVAVRVYYRGGLALEIDPKNVVLASPSFDAYERGYVDHPAIQTVRVASSVSWTLSVAALTPTWRYSGDLPDPQKPCGDLLWRVEYAEGAVEAVQKEFVSLAAGERTVAKGMAGSAKLSLSFRLLVSYENTWPGTYSLDFRYTLTSP